MEQPPLEPPEPASAGVLPELAPELPLAVAVAAAEPELAPEDAAAELPELVPEAAPLLAVAGLPEVAPEASPLELPAAPLLAPELAAALDPLVTAPEVVPELAAAVVVDAAPLVDDAAAVAVVVVDWTQTEFSLHGGEQAVPEQVWFS